MTAKDPLIYTTPIGRLSWPALFVPVEGMASDDNPGAEKKLKYEATLIIPKTASPAPLRELLEAVARAKWGDKLPSLMNSLRMPIRDGAEKPDTPGYGPDVWFIKANSVYKPDVKDGQLRNITDEASVYPGCMGRLVVKPFAYEHANSRGQIISRGVKLSLFAFQKTGEGEPFGTVVDATDYLSPVAEESAPAAGGYDWG